MLLVRIYASRARIDLDCADVARIVAGARRRNHQSDVTGMLLHGAGRFLQLLEGPLPALELAWARVVHDGRHRDVALLHETRAAARCFPAWSMGFARLDEHAHLACARAFLAHEGRFESMERSAERAVELFAGLRSARAEAWAATPQAA